ncbi:CoA-binding domain protein [Sulfitobacter noctilucicola]|uniref:Acyl-CoA synthetase (NDP forming) n=1 Tax=Sulfitobacter noctilucicola TaxID=1342301 RepID=A0A7W6M540_9RHOB|nr:acetate--CoA ligase family protein [Sulfitobacter noctilucicola]KIN62866.1 CoA-binding domain protein [Sulfitobacter noctilucicola]MBB4172603.1 acyl-CoA synthetase (NDP forming) [Sulfitobacter noctilucicola]
MTLDLDRLLRPQSIAVVGGGAWCTQVILQSRKMGFSGNIWPVHPSADTIETLPVFRSVDALPSAPDATFIGVNRETTIKIVRTLADMDAGGAVCFASGFLEAQAEDSSSADLQAELLKAAGKMPILGPNCYGYVNYLDGALLWPDQHGGKSVKSGVAIITQSSNIAINLTMQTRGLPLAYVVTAGNQAQAGLADIGRTLLDDPRVTALGLHIEGIGDLRAFEALAAHAHQVGKSIVAIKVGRSDQAQAATVSHTASLAGHDAGATALLRRLGIARVNDLPTFLETLKLLHAGGPLPSNAIATISCSGGEASLSADTGLNCGVTFPALNEQQTTDLRSALGPRVALANPLDYHTYIWRDVGAMTRTFAALSGSDIALTILIVDFPRADHCDPSDWDCVIEATIAASARTGRRYGMASTLPELMPEAVATQLLEAGVVPFSGLTEALGAAAAAASCKGYNSAPLLLPNSGGPSDVLTEREAKAALALQGLRVPFSCRCETLPQIETAADTVGYPQVLKGEGIAHKTEANAVRLNLANKEQTLDAARTMDATGFLIEEMITGTVTELLVGVLNDPVHGFILTLGAGGTLTELLADTATLLLPATDDEITEALQTLRLAPVLRGYRGADPVDMPSLLAAIRAVQNYAIEHRDTLQEIEINPLICTSTDTIAVDALLRRKP